MIAWVLIPRSDVFMSRGQLAIPVRKDTLPLWSSFTNFESGKDPFHDRDLGLRPRGLFLGAHKFV
jgi:hypothetical protein